MCRLVAWRWVRTSVILTYCITSCDPLLIVSLPLCHVALVHWWYFPASYDEWMDADDVSGEVESIPLSGELYGTVSLLFSFMFRF
jgi:hypothetical protein